jgi:hypothetical protein
MCVKCVIHFFLDLINNRPIFGKKRAEIGKSGLAEYFEKYKEY